MCVLSLDSTIIHANIIIDIVIIVIIIIIPNVKILYFDWLFLAH